MEHGWTHRDEIFARTAARLLTRPSRHWLDAFAAAGIWAGPVYGYADLLQDPQIRHNGSFVTYEHPTEGSVTVPGFPYKFSATPPRIDRGAPLVGEHTREVLSEAGLAEKEIEELLAAGALTETAS
ncbi:CoA transferase [Streptomyces violaceoruber]